MWLLLLAVVNITDYGSLSDCAFKFDSRWWRIDFKMPWLLLQCAACFRGFIYKYSFAVLGSESCHLLFIARLLLFALFLATVVHWSAKCLSLHYHQTVQTLSLHLDCSLQFNKMFYIHINTNKIRSVRTLCSVDSKHVFDYTSMIRDTSIVIHKVC